MGCPDVIDYANELAEREREYRASIRKPTVQRTGYCHAPGCGAELEHKNGVFCDTDCRDAWEREQKRLGMLGRRR